MAKCKDTGVSSLLEEANSAEVSRSRADQEDLETSDKLAKQSASQVLSAPAPAPSENPLRMWICFMVLTGGTVDYLANMFNDVVPDVEFGNQAAVFLTTVLSFLASAVPPTLAQADRRSLREVNSNNRTFKYKVMIPGLADLLITGMRYVAILYVAPAVVSILKSSCQLLVLSLIQHFRGKRLTSFLAMCLLGAFAGEVLVCSAGFLGAVPGIDPVGPPWIGVALAFASGSLGAVRNVMEEALLQGDDLSAGGLLMAESWISLIGTVIVSVVWHSSRGDLHLFLREVWAVCAIGPVWPLLIILMLCTYGKDFGKLFVTKYGNALTAKVLSLLFPIITWLLDLVTFAATQGQFGEGLDAVASPVQLGGFVVVAGACIAFVIRQKRPR